MLDHQKQLHCLQHRHIYINSARVAPSISSGTAFSIKLTLSKMITMDTKNLNLFFSFKVGGLRIKKRNKERGVFFIPLLAYPKGRYPIVTVN